MSAPTTVGTVPRTATGAYPGHSATTGWAMGTRVGPGVDAATHGAVNSVSPVQVMQRPGAAGPPGVSQSGMVAVSGPMTLSSHPGTNTVAMPSQDQTALKEDESLARQHRRQVSPVAVSWILFLCFLCFLCFCFFVFCIFVVLFVFVLCVFVCFCVFLCFLFSILICFCLVDWLVSWSIGWLID